MTQKQIKKLLRSQGYSFHTISFPFGSKGNNNLFWIMSSRSSRPLYFYLVLEDYDGSFESEYFLCQLTYDTYRTLYQNFDK